MGKALQIRVIAVTWDDDLLEKYWPRLSDLAFSVPVKHGKRGVLEMVRALADGLKFMKWPEARIQALGPGIEKAEKIREELEKALADWDPRRANALSDELEDELDRLESAYTG